MKILIILLAGATCLLAAFTVENKSITVGLCNGNETENFALQKTINQLGFNTYVSPSGASSDFALHNCQLVFDYYSSDAVSSDWKNEMIGNGRGYIQCTDSGWQLFKVSQFRITEGAMVTIQNVQRGWPLTSYPNQIPPRWGNARGLSAYSNQDNDFLAYSVENVPVPTITMLPYLGSATVGDVTCFEGTTVCANSLTFASVGRGQGVFFGWNGYGDMATKDDIAITENAIINAAQPPQADAGGPYYGEPGKEIILDAGKSRDNTAVVLFEWDFNNDGVFEFKDSAPTVKYVWKENQQTVVTLRCTDTIGARSYSKADVFIGYGTPTKSEVETKTLGTIKATYDK